MNTNTRLSCHYTYGHFILSLYAHVYPVTDLNVVLRGESSFRCVLIDDGVVRPEITLVVGWTLKIQLLTNKPYEEVYPINV